MDPERVDSPGGPWQVALNRLGRGLGLKPPQVRNLLYLLALGTAGMLVLASGGGQGPDRPTPTGATPVSGTAASAAPPAAAGTVGDELMALEARLARELETILGQVRGAGRVRATVTVATGPVQVLAADAKRQSRTVSEQDSGGGTRTTTDRDESVDTVVMRGSDGDSPMVLRRERPQVAGVLVVAAGAVQGSVRADLARAAAAALGIPPHRVTVLPMAESGGE